MSGREVAVRRLDDNVYVVIRESLRDEHNEGSCWTMCHADDAMRMFNIWTLKLPVDEASVILRGLIEAGVNENPRPTVDQGDSQPSVN